jgi:hypothetical protein
MKKPTKVGKKWRVPLRIPSPSSAGWDRRSSPSAVQIGDWDAGE